VALRAFAERAKQMIGIAYSAKSISAADCKTPQIDSYESGIDSAFQVTHPETKNDIPKTVLELNQSLLQMLKLN
jgi:hypothetical protein